MQLVTVHKEAWGILKKRPDCPRLNCTASWGNPRGKGIVEKSCKHVQSCTLHVSIFSFDELFKALCCLESLMLPWLLPMWPMTEGRTHGKRDKALWLHESRSGFPAGSVHSYVLSCKETLASAVPSSLMIITLHSQIGQVWHHLNAFK
eukprot:453807-Pelagomonas_calceolata.AAC.1